MQQRKRDKHADRGQNDDIPPRANYSVDEDDPQAAGDHPEATKNGIPVLTAAAGDGREHD